MTLSSLIIGAFIVLLSIWVFWKSRLARAIFVEAFTHPLRSATITIRDSSAKAESAEHHAAVQS